MTAGRVPLTDVTLDYWAAAAETAPPGELGMVNFPAVAQMLIADLRASRARAQELQLRIDRALDGLRNHVGAVLNTDTGEWLVSTERVCAVLTRTETTGV